MINAAIVPDVQNSTITWSVPNMVPGDQYWSDVTAQDWGALQGMINSSSINVMRFSIPLVGYVILWVHSKTGRALILICAGLLSLVLVLSSFKQLGKKAIQPEVIIDLCDHLPHDQLS
jgi:hypothetical protein